MVQSREGFGGHAQLYEEEDRRLPMLANAMNIENNLYTRWTERSSFGSREKPPSIQEVAVPGGNLNINMLLS
jgi:hypothetical protein